MLKRCIYNFPLFIVFTLLCFSIVIFNGSPDNRRIWDGYYLVGIPEGEVEDLPANDLWGDSEIVSAYNTILNFNDFGKMESIALKDIQSRFVKGDPRLDPYMLGVSEYFTTVDEAGSLYELIYVKSQLSPLKFYIQTRTRAGIAASEWLFPDTNILEGLLSAGLFFICLVFGIWLLKGQRIPAAVSGLPWLILSAVNGSSILPSSTALFIFFLLLMRELANDLLFYMNHREIRLSRGLFFYSSAFIIALSVHLYLNISGSLPVLPVLIAIVADFLCFFIYYSLKSQRVRMQEHSLFFPVSISRTPVAEAVVKRLPETAAAITAVIMIPLFSLFFVQNVPVEIPVPQTSETFASWSWESLDFIDKTYTGLVNASDYLSHQAFQSGFMYDRQWSFPYRDEKITSRQYLIENNEIMSKEVNILQFTEHWYISIINPETKTGLESLLLSQKSPGGIILKSDITEAVREFNPVRHVIISLMAIMPILGLFISRLSITLRRKGQEA